MKEYNKHLEAYNSEYYRMFSRSTVDEGGDKRVAEQYLEKYFLAEEEYLRIWLPIQSSIFKNEDQGLPEKVFQDDYSLFVFRGGITFAQEDFEILQQCLRDLGEQHFVVIQNDFRGKMNEPLLRMKYPVNISWQELTSGDFISTVLFDAPMNEYFVFGASANWGRYSANDYEHPLDILGFKPDLSLVFTSRFKTTPAEQAEIRTWLPPGYENVLT